MAPTFALKRVWHMDPANGSGIWTHMHTIVADEQGACTPQAPLKSSENIAACEVMAQSLFAAIALQPCIQLLESSFDSLHSQRNRAPPSKESPLNYPQRNHPQRNRAPPGKRTQPGSIQERRQFSVQCGSQFKGAKPCALWRTSCTRHIFLKT
eukprot:1137439-Pelagomonas_calceolata.AAC.1